MKLSLLNKYQQDIKILLVAISYFLFARLGYSLVFQDIYILPTWPPSGLALAFILILGRRIWPGITIGALLANILAYWNTGEMESNSIILMSSVIATGNTLEALVGYYLVNKFIEADLYFNKISYVFRFLAICLVISLLSSAIGTSMLYYQGLIIEGQIISRFVSWWVGNLVGIILFTPFILSFKQPFKWTTKPTNYIEITVFILGVSTVLFLINNEILLEPVQKAVPFLVFPLVLWLAVRFHLAISMAATIIIGLIAVYITIQDQGPFVMATSDNAMLLLQIFISVLAISTITLFATEKERNDTQEELKELNVSLEEKVQQRTKALEKENNARKKTEEELQESNKQLRKTNTELDNFVYRVSHDLRAPIASMMGLINLIRLEESEANRKEYLEKLEKSAELQDEFIKEILDQSRNARLDVEVEPINFKEIIEQTFEQLKFSSSTQDLQKEIEIEGEETFYSDPWRFKVILNNIISNSIRYRNGRDPEVKVHIKTDAQQAVISISDNGRGIEPEHIEKVFKMFYRATDDNAGSGLGLYIVKETVDKLSGEVKILSEFKKGTTVKITLPNKVKA